MNNPLSLKNFSREKLEMPNDEKKLLLHSCCAPCAGEIMEAVKASDIKTTVFFYNPNIHPHEEYEIRKDENKRFCEKLGFKFIDADYDKDNWFERIKGMEQINSSGKRAAERYANIYYWDFNWRKKGGSSRMIEISKREEFYQQEYCGCVYSLRDTNKWRQQNNKDRIIRGIKFYN